MYVEDWRPNGRPRKTWLEVVRNEMKELGLASASALNRHAWQRMIDPGLLGALMDSYQNE